MKVYLLMFLLSLFLSKSTKYAKKLTFDNEIFKNQAKVQAIVFDFLETVAPRNLLKDMQPIKRVTDLVMRLHDCTAMFYYPSLQRTRTMRWLGCVRAILVGLFLDTLIFGVFFPDGGVCEAYITKDTCLLTINKVTDAPQCLWTENAPSPQCSLRPPPSSTTFAVMIALVTVLLGLPLEMLLFFVMEVYCCRRPRLEDIGLSSKYWLGFALEIEYTDDEKKVHFTH